MKRIPGRRLWMLVGVALLIGQASAATAQSELTSAAVAKQVADRFGVEVLRIVESEMDGRPVFLVTVMAPGGDYDGAFQVTRLMVDRATGALVSQFRHRAAGYDLPGGAGIDVGAGADGRTIRRLTNQDRAVSAGE